LADAPDLGCEFRHFRHQRTFTHATAEMRKRQ
jgi:hypothetical protein